MGQIKSSQGSCYGLPTGQARPACRQHINSAAHTHNQSMSSGSTHGWLQHSMPSTPGAPGACRRGRRGGAASGPGTRGRWGWSGTGAPCGAQSSQRQTAQPAGAGQHGSLGRGAARPATCRALEPARRRFGRMPVLAAAEELPCPPARHPGAPRRLPGGRQSCQPAEAAREGSPVSHSRGDGRRAGGTWRAVDVGAAPCGQAGAAPLAWPAK